MNDLITIIVSVLALHFIAAVLIIVTMEYRTRRINRAHQNALNSLTVPRRHS